jgi:hypothetical protein
VSSDARERIRDAIEGNDLDELLRIVDALVATREWDQLVELRDRARLALERGRQLWPAASHAEYRLALDAPARYAAAVLVEEAARFAIGPVAEVAASTHTWSELAPHVARGPVAGLAAHERVIRGEGIDPATVPAENVLAVPLRLEPWEPQYQTATYYADRVEVDAPDISRGRPMDSRAGAVRVDDSEAERALRDLVAMWTAGSEGNARVATVEGDALDAISSLALDDVRGTWCSLPEALALMGWAAASGGRHGRRRGAAAGRDRAWAVLRALLDLDPDELPRADHVDRLRWFTFSARDATTGWILRLAVDDPEERLAWVIDAVDR